MSMWTVSYVSYLTKMRHGLHLYFLYLVIANDAFSPSLDTGGCLNVSSFGVITYYNICTVYNNNGNINYLIPLNKIYSICFNSLFSP